MEERDTTPPELPEAAQYAWVYFLHLNQTRQTGGFGGFSFITYQEKLAYFTLEGIQPEPFELELLKAWDKVAYEAYAKKEKSKEKQK